MTTNHISETKNPMNKKKPQIVINKNNGYRANATSNFARK